MAPIATVSRYNGRTGAFLNIFVPAGSGGLFGSDRLVFGPDGHLYVSSQDLVNGAILRYDGRTGAFLNTFVPHGSGGLDNLFSGLVFGPDGHLYVSNLFKGTILRYDGRTGAPLPTPGQSGAVFVPLGSGGLSNPRGLVFGPDGHLYASSSSNLDFANSTILRYDGRTGAPLPAPGQSGAVFVSPGSGGLFGPEGLVFFLP